MSDYLQKLLGKFSTIGIVRKYCLRVWHSLTLPNNYFLRRIIIDTNYFSILNDRKLTTPLLVSEPILVI